jgi:tetratricopeptide (TPR) repeat protein
LAAFQQLRRTLVDQLGVEPGATVQQVHRVILAGGDALGEYLRTRGTATGPGPGSATAAEGGAGARSAPEVVARIVPAQLPAPPAGFVGRVHQLKRLDELLSGDEAGRGLRVVVISGMAGVGKTALAVHWGQRVRDRFPDGQLYVNLRGYASSSPVRPVAALAGFLQALGVAAEQVPVELEAAAGRYRSLLADRRVLVVLDNASSIEQVRPLLPGGSGCLVLVTSRERLAGLVALEGAGHLDLAVLDPDEARDLLARILGEDRVATDPSAATALARMCGFLPLALRVAAANLTIDPQLSIAGQAAQLASGDRLAALAVDQDEQTAVRVALDHSYAVLPTETRRLFRMLGLVPGPHVTVDAAAALTGTTPELATRSLNRLASAHLLDQPEPRRYTLHDLVRLYAADRARDEDSAVDRHAAARRLFGWYLYSADAAGQLLFPDALRLPLPDSLRVPPARFDDHQHALAWLETERPNLVAAIQHTAGHGPYPVAYHLADALRGFYLLRSYAVERLAVAHAGLTAAQADQDIRAEVTAERSLGNAWLQQNQYPKAAEHFQRALTLSEQSGWVQAQCAALNGLGNTCQVEFRLAEAVGHYQRALALNQQSGWLIGQMANLTNLAAISIFLGSLRQAADYASEALTLCHQLGYRSREAHVLANLGVIHYLLGLFDEAEADLTRALTLSNEVGDQANRAEYQRALAAVHRDTGRHSQAITFAQEALASAREARDRRMEAEALATLGAVHFGTGRYEHALETGEHAVRVARETSNRVTEVAALIGIAAAQQHLGQRDRATDAVHTALDLARQDGYRVEEGKALTTLAAIELAAGRVAEAAAHAERAIAIQQETGHRLGEARARRELGNALERQGAAGAAIESWRRAFAIFTDIGSPDADQLSPLVSEG